MMYFLFGQALRIRRICSVEEKFRMGSEELVGWMVERVYREDFVREQIERASNFDSFIRKVDIVILKKTRLRC